MMELSWCRLISAVALSGLSLCAFGEDGVTDNTILVGQTIGITGVIAAPVKELNEGANAYLAMVNKQGGVHGRKIELRTLDDKFDPAQTGINAKRLIEQDKVFTLFLNRGTPNSEKILPLLEANAIPLVAPSTGAALLHSPPGNKWVFNVRAKYQDEVIKGVEHFATLGMKNIGLVHVDDSFGRDGLEGFSKVMNAQQLTPAVISKFDRTAPDFPSAVAAVMKAAPSALVIVSSSKQTIELIKAIRSAGGKMQIMTLSNNTSQSFVKDLGPDGVGVIVTQVTPAAHLLTTKLGQEFKAAAKETGATPSYAAMEGFVAAKVLVEGLRRAGRNLTREGFVRGLESMQRVDFGGLMVTYGPGDHSGSEFVELTMISRDGRFMR